MQVERVVTFCFLGWGGDAELISNQQSYRERYLNTGRHPKLASYQDVVIHNEAGGRTTTVDGKVFVHGKAEASTDRIGVYVLAHGDGGNAIPGVAYIVKRVVETLKRADGTLPIAKLNLAVCQGASKLNSLKVAHNQNDFSNGTLKKMCADLQERHASKTIKLPDGMLVCGYAVNVETFDSGSAATKEKLGAGYKPDADAASRIRTVRVDHDAKQYHALHPDWQSLGAAAAGHGTPAAAAASASASSSPISGDSRFLAQTVRAAAEQKVWDDRNANPRFVDGLRRNPALDAVQIDKAWKFDSFADMAAAHPGVADEVCKRKRSDIDSTIRTALAGHLTGPDLARIQSYVRNKVALKFEAATQRFRVCALSEYTDSAIAKDWLDIVSHHVMPPEMSPLKLQVK